MHWKAKHPVRPTEGSKRTVRRFAWWPTLVDLDEEQPVRVWLEHYYAYQEATIGGYSGLQWHTIAKYSCWGLPL